jgi:RimJ/RimL family protein N-acetyltransferase
MESTAAQRLLRYRPMQPGDIDQVCAWFQSPHLAGICGVAGDRSRLELEIMERLESDWLFPHILLMSGRPVGYLQYYVAGVRAKELHLDDARGVLGVDFCVGDPRLLGRGLGSLGLKQAVELLFREAAIRALVADPNPGNTAAIKTYERVGFRVVTGMPLSDRGGLLLRLQKAADAPARA